MAPEPFFVRRVQILSVPLLFGIGPKMRTCIVRNCRTVPYYAVLCCTAQCAVRVLRVCCAVLCVYCACTVLCCAVLCGAVLTVDAFRRRLLCRSVRTRNVQNSSPKVVSSSGNLVMQSHCTVSAPSVRLNHVQKSVWWRENALPFTLISLRDICHTTSSWFFPRSLVHSVEVSYGTV